MKDKKAKNSNDVKQKNIDYEIPIADIYTNMFCADELENYYTDYYDASNVTRDK